MFRHFMQVMEVLQVQAKIYVIVCRHSVLAVTFHVLSVAQANVVWSAGEQSFAFDTITCEAKLLVQM